MKRILLTAAALTLVTPVATAAQDFEASNDGVTIEEWTVPYEESRPRDPFAASAEEVWFVGQRTGYLASLNTGTGEFEQVDLGEGAGPHNLVVAEDGGVWYAGNRRAHVGRYDPKSGEIEKVAMPDEAARDPHTLIFDEAGDVWFTVQGGNKIGKLTVADRGVQLIDVPTEGARPYGIKTAPDGTVWVALFGTHKLASIDPETMALTEHDLPREEARPRRLEVTDDGRVWYGDYAAGKLGVLSPDSGEFTEWDLPSGTESRPYGTAMDSDGNIWVFETGVEPNRLVGFNPDTQEFFASVEVPSGGGTVRHTHYHAPTDTIWFGADTNTIGRVTFD